MYIRLSIHRLSLKRRRVYKLDKYKFCRDIDSGTGRRKENELDVEPRRKREGETDPQQHKKAVAHRTYEVAFSCKISSFLAPFAFVLFTYIHKYLSRRGAPKRRDVYFSSLMLHLNRARS